MHDDQQRGSDAAIMVLTGIGIPIPAAIDTKRIAGIVLMVAGVYLARS